MLNLRNEQIEALKSVPLKQFEVEMVAHVKKFFPNHFRIAGEPVIYDIVRLGISKAREYDFTTQRNVCLYITVMIMLGSYFDEDPMYWWMQPDLDVSSNESPSDRAAQMADKALEFQRQIAGNENRDMNRAFLILKNNPSVIVEDFPAGSEYEKDMIVRLSDIFPKKAAIIGESSMHQLINEGLVKAAMYGITSKRGQSLITVMMFILGTAIDKEPFLPWVAAILKDPTLPNEAARIDKLYSAALSFLDEWLEKP